MAGSGIELGYMVNRLVDGVVESCVYLGRMEYRGTSWIWVDRCDEVPEEPGVYFLVSDEGVEKVGSARGLRGLRGRLAGYCRSKSEGSRMDSTDELWKRVAGTGELAGRGLDVYCIVLPRRLMEVVTDIGRVSVEFVPVLEVEAHYFGEAKRCGEPMRLSGGAA